MATTTTKTRSRKPANTTTKGRKAPAKATKTAKTDAQTPAKDEAKDKAPAKPKTPPTREEWLTTNKSTEGKDGREYTAQEGWLTNYEGDQTAKRPEVTPTHKGNEANWLGDLIRTLIERGGWSARQLSLASGVSLGQIAGIRKGSDPKTSTAARLLAAMGADLTTK